VLVFDLWIWDPDSLGEGALGTRGTSTRYLYLYLYKVQVHHLCPPAQHGRYAVRILYATVRFGRCTSHQAATCTMLTQHSGTLGCNPHMNKVLHRIITEITSPHLPDPHAREYCTHNRKQHPALADLITAYDQVRWSWLL